MAVPPPYPPLLVILGPTASGKSALALDVARRIGAELLSVDSMQVYRGMDIGTAKPSADEQRAVRHHLIDLADATEEFTTARFVEAADAVVEDAKRRSVPLIACGGTPLYYKALFEGMFEGPGRDDALREQLAALSRDELHRRLSSVDPQAAQRLHRNDTRRIIRALEVHSLTGQSISSLQQEWTSGTIRHNAHWFGLLWDKDVLNRRINARVKQMMEAGWVEEVRSLLNRSSALSRTAAEATGYAELIEHIQNATPLDDAVEQIKIATRQLARRQMKWFRRWKQVQWLDGTVPVEQLAHQVIGRITSPPAAAPLPGNPCPPGPINSSQ